MHNSMNFNIKDFDICKMESESMHFQQLMNTIKKQTDTVTFKIGNEGKIMEVTRLCLAAISSVFETMLYGGMRESEPNALIQLPDIEPAIFEFLVNFAYGKKVWCNDKNIISIMKVADKYQIEMLSIKCHGEFEKMITVHTICNLFNDVIKHDCIFYRDNILEKIKSYFGHYAEQIIETEAFMKMNSDAMNLFLTLDCLNVSEYKLYEKVLEWAKYQTKNRFSVEGLQCLYDELPSNDNYYKQLLIKVCKNIRFATMVPEYLAGKRKEINITLCHEDFVNILCYRHKQDQELLEIIRKKFIVTPRSFKGYGALLPYHLLSSTVFSDVVDMRCMVNIKKIEIITRPGYTDLHKIVAQYLEVHGNDNENEWEFIAEFDDKRIILCDVKTTMLRFNKKGLGYAFNVISACKIFGFALL